MTNNEGSGAYGGFKPADNSYLDPVRELEEEMR